MKEVRGIDSKSLCTYYFNNGLKPDKFGNWYARTCDRTGKECSASLLINDRLPSQKELVYRQKE